MIRTGALARKANVSKRTLQYYEQIGLLKPTVISENGYRHYDDRAVFRLQKILLLKSIGYTLQQIKQLLRSHEDADEHEEWLNSLKQQIELMERQKEELSRKQYYLRSAIDILNLRGLSGMGDLLEIIEGLNDRPLVEGVVPAEFGDDPSITREEQDALAKLPVWGSGDERLGELLSLLRQASDMMPASPYSEEAQVLAGRLDAQAKELFGGDSKLLDTYWEWIKPQEGEQPAVIGLENELMDYVEKMIDFYRKRKEGGPDGKS